MQTRENTLEEWLKTIYPSMDFSITPLAGDASFRRYYRLQCATHSQIVMDAPPTQVPLTPFVAVADILSQLGIKTPLIHAVDYTFGFALLEDFGTILLNDVLKNTPEQTRLYQKAIALLQKMQQPLPHSVSVQLDLFDQTFMLNELNLFHEWFIKRMLGITLSTDEQQLHLETFEHLTAHVSQQPRVLIHRDYHSRNIMLPHHANTSQPSILGVIDFQDAMIGPITYDLVSLLKDSYVELSPEFLHSGLNYFFECCALSQHYSFTEFQQAFDWCGLQRHLKNLGIFSRLHLRDGKSNYLKDIPLTLHYVLTCVERYPEFTSLSQWLQARVLPLIADKHL